MQFVDPDLSAISAAVTALEELSLNKDRTRWVIKHVEITKRLVKRVSFSNLVHVNNASIDFKGFFKRQFANQ